MSETTIPDDLRTLVEAKTNAGELLTAAQVAAHLDAFTSKFGVEVLANSDGEALLRLMHGRRKDEAPCLMYWLEFKNDEEFPGGRYGGIGGGAATKFGVYQRQADGAWVTGSPSTMKVIDTAEAVAIARSQRNELVEGVKVLQALSPGDTSDATYARVQADMQAAAPDLYRSGWAHKYWSLCMPDRVDDFHSPRWQRYHLIKLLQLPPDPAVHPHGGGPCPPAGQDRDRYHRCARRHPGSKAAVCVSRSEPGLVAELHCPDRTSASRHARKPRAVGTTCGAARNVVRGFRGAASARCGGGRTC